MTDSPHAGRALVGSVLSQPLALYSKLFKSPAQVTEDTVLGNAEHIKSGAFKGPSTCKKINK